MLLVLQQPEHQEHPILNVQVLFVVVVESMVLQVILVIVVVVDRKAATPQVAETDALLAAAAVPVQADIILFVCVLTLEMVEEVIIMLMPLIQLMGVEQVEQEEATVLVEVLAVAV